MNSHERLTKHHEVQGGGATPDPRGAEVHEEYATARANEDACHVDGALDLRGETDPLPEERGPGGFEALPDGSVTLRYRPEDEAATYEMGGRHHAFDHLAEVSCPVVVVSGADVPGPAMVAGPIVDALPQGRLVPRSDMSHFGPLEQPGEIASMIRAFLDELDT